MLHTKLKNIAQQLKSEYFERDHIIDASLAAILARQHVVLLGLPGTAKSSIIDAVCSRITDARYFQWLMTKFSTPEEIFGPISLKSLEQDNYRRITTGKLPSAHIVFLDEVMKANSAILNSLLTAVNERAFDNGTVREQIPLISVFGASNELPEERELDALFDRFILRFDIKYIQDGSNWEALMGGGGQTGGNETITLAELEQAQVEASQLAMPVQTIGTMRNIKMVLEREGIVASDRRWKQSISVLKAQAWLAGDSEVGDQHLDLLCDMLWREPEQRATIVSHVMSVTNPLNLEAIKLYDSCRDVYSKFHPGSTTSAEEIAAKLRIAIQEIDNKLKYADPSKTAKMKEVKSQIRSWYQGVLKSMEL